ncbi:MAG: SdrD B-like domain-containing protein, partial [Anaerolineaceae bacterium]|nr:SdrD B-like domain-containing protein [Anaerolineaceae bacterium]
MQKKLLLALSLFGLLAFGLLPAVPAAAGVQPQFAYHTPTPDGSGRIFYIVGEGDSCLRIELLTGVKVDQIRTLNQLDANCTIQPGQRLLLLVVEPATPEPSPVHTPPPAEPTPTTFLGNARVCILLFEDINGNATPDSGENQVSEGVISLSDRTGEVSLTGTTTNSAAPLCFEDVPEGEYNLSVALPEGYN